MAITINYGPSAAAVGSVAFDAGRGIEKRRRKETDRDFNLRAQSQAFSMQQAALQEKARRRQEQMQMQQQLFNQQRQRAEYQRALQQQAFSQQSQRAEYGRALQNDAFGRSAAYASHNRSVRNDAFGQQRDQALYNRSMVNDAFDRSYQRAVFGQNQERYDAMQEQADYARKAPFLANMNKALMERVDNIREQYDDAQWKTPQAKNEYIGLMQQLPGIMGQDAPTETANKLLSDFIQTFDNKGFKKKVAPPLTQTEVTEQELVPIYSKTEIDPNTKKPMQTGYTWGQGKDRKILMLPSGSSASGQGSVTLTTKEIRDYAKDLQQSDREMNLPPKPLSEYLLPARQQLQGQINAMQGSSQQPTDTMSVAGQGEGERPEGAGIPLAQQADGIRDILVRQKVADPGVIERIYAKHPQALQALADLPEEERKAGAVAIQQALARGEQPALPGNKTFSRREILNMVENSPEDVPFVWNEKETMTTKSLKSLPQGSKAKVDAAKKKASGIKSMTVREGSEEEPLVMTGDKSLRLATGYDDEIVRAKEYDKKQFNNMVRLVNSGQLTNEQAEDITDDLFDKGLITEEKATSMIDQHNANQEAVQQDEPADQDNELSRIAKEKDMRGYAKMYMRLITSGLDPKGEGVMGKGSGVYNSTTPDGRRQALAAQFNKAFAMLSQQMGKPDFEQKVRKLIEVFRAEQARIQQ